MNHFLEKIKIPILIYIAFIGFDIVSFLMSKRFFELRWLTLVLLFVHVWLLLLVSLLTLFTLPGVTMALMVMKSAIFVLHPGPYTNLNMTLVFAIFQDTVQLHCWY